MQLSQKELMNIEDQLEQEMMLIKKFNHYAQMAQSSDVKDLCQNIAKSHQQHYNMLMQQLSGNRMMS